MSPKQAISPAFCERMLINIVSSTRLASFFHSFLLHFVNLAISLIFHYRFPPGVAFYPSEFFKFRSQLSDPSVFRYYGISTIVWGICHYIVIEMFSPHSVIKYLFFHVTSLICSCPLNTCSLISKLDRSLIINQNYLTAISLKFHWINDSFQLFKLHHSLNY